jgi:hypothetical protein
MNKKKIKYLAAASLNVWMVLVYTFNFQYSFAKLWVDSGFAISLSCQCGAGTISAFTRFQYQADRTVNISPCL